MFFSKKKVNNLVNKLVNNSTNCCFFLFGQEITANDSYLFLFNGAWEDDGLYEARMDDDYSGGYDAF